MMKNWGHVLQAPLYLVSDYDTEALRWCF